MDKRTPFKNSTRHRHGRRRSNRNGYKTYNPKKYGIRYAYIRKPILIKRGSLVTINLTTPMMRLTAQGKALQEGSIGDTVQVKNTQSKQKIEARVTGVNKVAVVLLERNALN